MRILIHSLIFSPDGVSTAYLYNDIALKFQKEGYNVTVLTTTPHYNVLKKQLEKQPLKWRIWGIYKTSNFHGIKVIHIPQKKFKNTFLRLIGFVYWHIISFFIGLCQSNIDIILSPSPPLTIGLLNIFIAKIKKCKVIYNVQEIYPDILNKKNGFIINILKKIEKYIYHNSTAVTTIDDVFYNTIIDRFEEKSKLHIIPNFVDTELFNPQNKNSGELDSNIFPKNNNLKVLYAGNIGFAQDWKPLIRLAKATKNSNIEYFVIGEGVMRPYLEKEKTTYNLQNLHIIDYQPRHLMPLILAYSDIQFIFMSPEMEKMGFPSKVYTIMACAKPLLICSGENTPIINFTKKYNCAKLITEHDSYKKTEEMYKWLTSASQKELEILGKNGYAVIQQLYTKEKVTQQYVDLVNHL